MKPYRHPPPSPLQTLLLPFSFPISFPSHSLPSSPPFAFHLPYSFPFPTSLHPPTLRPPYTSPYPSPLFSLPLFLSSSLFPFWQICDSCFLLSVSLLLFHLSSFDIFSPHFIQLCFFLSLPFTLIVILPFFSPFSFFLLLYLSPSFLCQFLRFSLLLSPVFFSFFPSLSLVSSPLTISYLSVLFLLPS